MTNHDFLDELVDILHELNKASVAAKNAMHRAEHAKDRAEQANNMPQILCMRLKVL